MAHTFHIGQFVTNFGLLAEVVGFHPVTGYLILKEVSTLSHKDCGRWLADPERCEAAPGTEMPRHKDGLVALT